MNCYAEIMAKRLKAMGVAKYVNEFKLAIHEKTLEEPLGWRQPHTIFVCSMSDLFHEAVPVHFLDKVMEVIEATPWHRYQLLTKRSHRMVEYFSKRQVPANAWLGTTVEAQGYKHRIDDLRNLSASVLFLSCEPLLENLGSLDLSNIDWVIVGGESGPRARPMKEEWVLSIKEQAKDQGCAFFFKQWGTWGSDGVKRTKQANGKILAGRVIQEMPELAEAAL